MVKIQQEPKPESPGPTPPNKDTPKSQPPKKVTKKRKVHYNTDDDDNKDDDYRPSSHATSSGEFEEDDELSASSTGLPQKKRVYKPSKLQKVSMADSPRSAKKGRIWPKENNSLYTSGNQARNMSTTDLPSSIRSDEDAAPNSSLRRPASSSAKQGSKAPLGSKRVQTSPKSRRSISPYPYSSPERPKKHDATSHDGPFTAIPGAETKDGGKVPPIPAIPKALVENSLKSKDPRFDSENLLKTRSGQRKIVVEGTKTAQEKMHAKGKMSITETKNTEKFEWPDDVF